MGNSSSLFDVSGVRLEPRTERPEVIDGVVQWDATSINGNVVYASRVAEADDQSPAARMMEILETKTKMHGVFDLCSAFRVSFFAIMQFTAAALQLDYLCIHVEHYKHELVKQWVSRDQPGLLVFYSKPQKDYGGHIMTVLKLTQNRWLLTGFFPYDGQTVFVNPIIDKDSPLALEQIAGEMVTERVDSSVVKNMKFRRKIQWDTDKTYNQHEHMGKHSFETDREYAQRAKREKLETAYATVGGWEICTNDISSEEWVGRSIMSIGKERVADLSYVELKDIVSDLKGTTNVTYLPAKDVKFSCGLRGTSEDPGGIDEWNKAEGSGCAMTAYISLVRGLNTEWDTLNLRMIDYKSMWNISGAVEYAVASINIVAAAPPPYTVSVASPITIRVKTGSDNFTDVLEELRTLEFHTKSMQKPDDSIIDSVAFCAGSLEIQTRTYTGEYREQLRLCSPSRVTANGVTLNPITGITTVEGPDTELEMCAVMAPFTDICVRRVTA